MARLARDEFDRDPREIALLDKIDIVNPLISELMLAPGGEVAQPGLRQIYRDSLLVTLGITVLRRHSSLVRDSHSARTGSRARGELTRWQLRRVLDHMAAHVLSDVRLDELVHITGLSRAQFSRAFRTSTGQTPARRMLQLRMQHAADLPVQGQTINDVGSHLAAAFEKYSGANPPE
jgi:AraC family transcriptional regulator